MFNVFSLSTSFFLSLHPFVSLCGGSTWCSGDGRRVLCSQPIITPGPLEGFKGSWGYLDNEGKKLFMCPDFFFSFFFFKQFCSFMFKWFKWNNLISRSRSQTEIWLTWFLFIFSDIIMHYHNRTPASQCYDDIWFIFSFNRHLLYHFTIFQIYWTLQIEIWITRLDWDVCLFVSDQTI